MHNADAYLESLAEVAADAEAMRDLIDHGVDMHPNGANDEPVPELHLVPPVDTATLVLTPIEEFAAVNERGAEPLARATPDGGSVLTANGLVIVYGDGGAGKTTLMNDLLFALATGKSWLALVEPDRPLRIAMVENEGPRQEFRKKLERKIAASNVDLGGRIVVLEEPWAEFNFAREDHREAIANAIDLNEIDVLVVGPLASVGVEGGGTPEEIERFAKLLLDVRRRCTRTFAAILIHHENRAGQISGAWERVPDTLIHVTGQGHGRTRVYWQKVRWASALHETSTHLIWADGESYTVDAKPEVTEDTMEADLLAAVTESPGGSWTQLRAHITGKAIDAAKVRDRLITQGALINSASQDGRFNLWHPDDPACPRSLPGTALERPKHAPPAGATTPDPFPVPSLERNGRNGNGHAAPEATNDDIEF